MEARVVQILKALSDESRLRILGVIRHEPLSVNELLSVLEMGQSRVSRHLKILADAGILERNREGSRIYYGLHPVFSHSDVISGILKSLGLNGTSRVNGEDPIGGMDPYLASEMKQDLERLARVLEDRKSISIQHFQLHGLEQDRQQRGYVDPDYYRRKIVEILPPESGTVVDLGSGTGELASMLIPHIERLICVDQSINMLDRARMVVDSENADFRIGSLEHLPLRDEEADTVIASMVLHHMPEPAIALREARRVLKKGGHLIISDLKHHGEEIMRSRFADFWLGFDPERLEELVAASGFEIVDDSEGTGAGSLTCLFIRAKAVKN
jgi:ArsR family transcriptional regulator